MKKYVKHTALVLAISLTVASAAPVTASAATKPVFTKKYATVKTGKNYVFKVSKIKKGTSVKWKITGDIKKYVSFAKNKVSISETTKSSKATASNKIYARKAVSKAKTGYIKVTVTGKNGKKYTISNMIKLSATKTTPTPDTNQEAAVSKNANDVAVLKKIIQEQKALGAVVSEDLDSTEYTWTEMETESGKELRLTGIDWSSKKLSGEISVVGLEQLKSFYVDKNELTSLDVSENPKLTNLSGSYNQLRSLDISRNPALTRLHCPDNELSSLDISGNPKLTELYCNFNELESLDVSGNPELTILVCSNNQLSSLDVSGNPELIQLTCGGNQLSSLDVSKNLALTRLTCDKNQLNNLDISRNSKLTYLFCTYNSLNSLDVSGNPKLTELYCDYNEIESLDVSRNPELIQLYCGSNQLSSLDISGNSKLTKLLCYSNQLNSLDISKNLALEELYCNENQLSSLDVTNNMALIKLWCDKTVNVIGGNSIEISFI